MTPRARADVLELDDSVSRLLYYDPRAVAQQMLSILVSLEDYRCELHVVDGGTDLDLVGWGSDPGPELIARVRELKPELLELWRAAHRAWRVRVGPPPRGEAGGRP